MLISEHRQECFAERALKWISDALAAFLLLWKRAYKRFIHRLLDEPDVRMVEHTSDPGLLTIRQRGQEKEETPSQEIAAPPQDAASAQSSAAQTGPAPAIPATSKSCRPEKGRAAS
jgi:hypothetical protein